jgi:hypothetical protein
LAGGEVEQFGVLAHEVGHGDGLSVVADLVGGGDGVPPEERVGAVDEVELAERWSGDDPDGDGAFVDEALVDELVDDVCEPAGVAVDGALVAGRIILTATVLG